MRPFLPLTLALLLSPAALAGDTEDPDRDADGYGESVDCNDHDPMVNPGATEVFGDDIDNDCDGSLLCPLDVCGGVADVDDDDYQIASSATYDLFLKDIGEGHTVTAVDGHILIQQNTSRAATVVAMLTPTTVDLHFDRNTPLHAVVKLHRTGLVSLTHQGSQDDDDIDYAEFPMGVTIHGHGGGDGDHITGTAFDDHIEVLGSGDTPGVHPVISGGPGNDVLVGSNASEDLYGDAGDDTIHARGGDDYLEGGAGVDTLNGEGGDDILVGPDPYAGTWETADVCNSGGQEGDRELCDPADLDITDGVKTMYALRWDYQESCGGDDPAVREGWTLNLSHKLAGDRDSIKEVNDVTGQDDFEKEDCQMALGVHGGASPRCRPAGTTSRSTTCSASARPVRIWCSAPAPVTSTPGTAAPCRPLAPARPPRCRPRSPSTATW